jgi:two-component system response regulator DesR
MRSMSPMRVLIADDQASVRSALGLILSQDARLKIVGEVTRRDELVTSIRQTEPDLVLIEWEMIDSEPRSMVNALREIIAGLRIVVMSGRPESRSDALAAGVDEFISKVDPPHQLGSLLHAIGQAG